MHPIIAVCVVLVLAGGAMALRWGHLDVVPPWTADADAEVSMPDHLRRGLWYGAVFIYASFVAGLLVLGPGGRLAMRLLAATAGDDAQGRLTEAEEVVGEITVGGTISFILFVGLFGGVLLGAIYLLLRKWLPPRRWGALTVALLFGVVASTRLEPLRPDNEDFDLVGPAWLAVATFLGLGALTMLTMGAVAGRISRSLPLVEKRVGAILPYLPALLVLPAGSLLAPAVVAAAVGLVVLRRAEVRRLWAHPRVLLAGRLAIALVVVAYLPSFVRDVADILG